MKPKPFSLLNHFTVPVATGVASSGLARSPVWRPHAADGHDRRLARSSRAVGRSCRAHRRGLGTATGTTVSVTGASGPVRSRRVATHGLTYAGQVPGAGERWC